MQAEKTKHLIAGQRPIVNCSVLSGRKAQGGLESMKFPSNMPRKYVQRSEDGTRDVTNCAENCAGKFVKILWVSLVLELSTSNLKQPHLCIQIEAALDYFSIQAEKHPSPSS